MKLKIRISNLAILDLENIFEYTMNKWSLQQAEEYYKGIQSEFDAISLNPALGKSIQEIKKNHRCKVCKSHFIIYKVENEIVFIDRILHQRMNITEILNE